ncbi:malate dehydrogenase (oxaloacetate-decarboxylating)(NADP+) [Monoraphidium neglectum]|uniref:Malate dehydrogenase (Oxaloacetate-decarboxylating)(NADP+) n=1 Tax=Monoraphidium neglectum TaxID=145388 RepID=A0A0D2NQY7_9CHLO|nr:malate dehydrogenase (oxaloacetate-decarboxylating)(NADP+) [Monoraphidium neglectum]KIZ06731.1 malate dehydrogenase (oxaloacetate-decarboxylating)(NADP+) [Monoraphidium neglectum]|eukprot:XP_013905750.1 malate dehydrogenase (oxaloacetate-decarboxylating)(NADP+) [Monoraphidium neglectum]
MHISSLCTPGPRQDFGNRDAFRLLDTYKDTACVFNDDIQGTAVITLAGLLSAAGATEQPDLSQHRILFMGAGEAAIGIASLIAHYAHARHGVPEKEARRTCYFVDTHGLVTVERKDGLAPHKLPFAHEGLEPAADLHAAIRQLRPTALVGVSTVKGAFDRQALQLMAEFNPRPIIMPLSNPDSKCECTFEEAFRGTNGRALFASGSPMPPYTDADGKKHTPAQANNVYVFPAVALAAVLASPRAITDELLLAAAEAVAGLTTPEDAARGE